MRLCALLAFLGMTVFACGRTDNKIEEATPEATGPAGGPYNTTDDPIVLFDKTKEAIVGASAIVPPDSGIEHEGIVWLEVRTVNTVIDTAWVIVSSGFPEVDDFALNQVQKKTRPWKVGWGDPPFKLQFVVRVPEDSDGQEEPSTEFDTAEVGAFPFLAAVPPGSNLEHEGDVRAVLHVVDELIDTAWIVESSGYPEVDEFAIEHVMTVNLPRSSFARAFRFKYMEDDTLNAVIFVRHQPKN
ncbi:MAG: hypothetical protein F4Z81_05700 [Gemmatimonadetes bacterium]|nr:hypothetical protein [Gemmatimonadota bacterium]MYB62074.1 hypothetical protein [Gemmatimonadota bacterium]